MKWLEVRSGGWTKRPSIHHRSSELRERATVVALYCSLLLVLLEEAEADEVLTVEDLQGLLEGLDLLLPPGHLLLVGLAGGDALGLQLLEVLHRAVRLLLGERLLLILLQGLLVLHVLLLRGLVQLTVVEEALVLPGRLLLLGGGLGLQADEVRLDHLDHPHHAAAVG